MKNDRTGWSSILGQDEKILWQGRPSPGFRVLPAQIATLLFGLAFSGFALFWMVMAASAGGYFWTFGLIHFSVGIGIGVGPVFYSALKIRNTWYTLSNQRAFIATDLPVIGRRIKSYPISRQTPLEIRESTPPSVYFAHEFKQGKNRSYRIDIGFEGIEDAGHVLELLRGIQTSEVPVAHE